MLRGFRFLPASAAEGKPKPAQARTLQRRASWYVVRYPQARASADTTKTWRPPSRGLSALSAVGKNHPPGLNNLPSGPPCFRELGFVSKAVFKDCPFVGAGLPLKTAMIESCPWCPKTRILFSSEIRASLTRTIESFWGVSYSLLASLRSPYWQASHSSPFIMASIEQAFFSASLYSFFAGAASFVATPARPRTSFFTLVVAFSILEAPMLRR